MAIVTAARPGLFLAGQVRGTSQPPSSSFGFGPRRRQAFAHALPRRVLREAAAAAVTVRLSSSTSLRQLLAERAAAVESGSASGSIPSLLGVLFRDLARRAAGWASGRVPPGTSSPSRFERGAASVGQPRGAALGAATRNQYSYAATPPPAGIRLTGGESVRASALGLSLWPRPQERRAILLMGLGDWLMFDTLTEPEANGKRKGLALSQ